MNSLTDVWGSVLQQMSQQLAPTTINTWFDEVDVVTMEDSAFVLHCGNEFKKKTIETRFLSYIRDALRDLFSADFEIKILNDDQLSAYHGIKPDYPGDLEDSGTFTFETYVVGPSNKLAYAAAHAVSDRPGVNYNPLFIYGDSGLGKTHLLYAIAHGLKQNYPDAKVVYIKGDDFTNELVASIREGKNAEFREKYRQATLLLVDDVQFIAGKEQTQEEFFHTFNSLYEAGKQIVLTSDSLRMGEAPGDAGVGRGAVRHDPCAGGQRLQQRVYVPVGAQRHAVRRQLPPDVLREALRLGAQDGLLPAQQQKAQKHRRTRHIAAP